MWMKIIVKKNLNNYGAKQLTIVIPETRFIICYNFRGKGFLNGVEQTQMRNN